MWAISDNKEDSSRRREGMVGFDLVRMIYLLGEGKDLVPTLCADFVEELRARDVWIMLKSVFDLLLPELLHEGLL